MAKIWEAKQALVSRILQGNGHSSHADRRAAFDDDVSDGPLQALVHKLTRNAPDVTDEDVAAVRASGLTEDQVFELVVCAAVGEASRRHEVAMAALETTTKGE
jgi:alkylhydroperoxidase family enzyme